MTDRISVLVRFLADLERLKLVERKAHVSDTSTQGVNWKEQSVSRSQVLRVSEPVREHAPEIYEWMQGKIEEAVRAGWLIDA